MQFVESLLCPVEHVVVLEPAGYKQAMKEAKVRAIFWVTLISLKVSSNILWSQPLFGHPEELFGKDLIGSKCVPVYMSPLRSSVLAS